VSIAGRYVGDTRSRFLSERLRRAADAIREPQRSRIIRRLPERVFISHTSSDDRCIRSCICPIVEAVYPDPFFHSIKTGAPDAYEKIIGLALLSSHRLLSIWSRNSVNSDYFLAEQHLAISERKSIIVFCIDHGFSPA
jgi:hypothetical protein